MGLVVCSLGVWRVAPGDRGTTTEAYVYYAFADAVVDGDVPYRDVTIEYPPGALPVFLAPIGGFGVLGSTDGARWGEAAENDAARRYEAGLAITTTVLLALTLVATAVSLLLLGATLGHALLALGTVAAAPLLLGALPLTRYDAWPVLLTSLGVTATLAGRRRLAGGALAAAATAKLYPLVLLPVVLARAWEKRGRRGLASVLGAGALVAGVVVGPFLVLAPAATTDAIRLQLSRGLQMESLGGSILSAAWKLSQSLDAPLPVGSCQRCGEGLVAAQLTGTLADLVGLVSSLAVVAVLAVVVRRTLREPSSRSTDALAVALSVTALVVVGKVLSAQFLLWLLPLVPLVAGRRGRLATGLLLVASVMTNVWFPTLYRDYVNVLDPEAIAFLLVRNALLVGVLAVLLCPERRARPPE